MKLFKRSWPFFEELFSLKRANLTLIKQRAGWGCFIFLLFIVMLVLRLKHLISGALLAYPIPLFLLLGFWPLFRMECRSCRKRLIMQPAEMLVRSYLFGSVRCARCKNSF